MCHTKMTLLTPVNQVVGNDPRETHVLNDAALATGLVAHVYNFPYANAGQGGFASNSDLLWICC